MGEKIKVSVIIPVYNAEKYLRQCLDSVINQTLREIEIICVNDGSFDNSLKILEEYADRDDRITIISQRNAGPSAARNAALDTATGRYVYMLDSDDYLDADALKELYDRCEKDDLDVLMFDVQRFYDDAALKAVITLPSDSRKEYAGVYTGADLMSQMRDNHQYVCTAWIAIYRRDLLERNHISFLDGIIHEDELFSFHVMMNAQRVSHVGKKYYHRRIRRGSIMTSPKTFKNVFGYFSCMEQILCYGLSQDWPESKQKAIWRSFSAMLGSTKNIYGKLSSGEKQKAASLDPLSRLLFDRLVLSNDSAAGLSASNEAALIRSSVSYRIGCSITFLPRKVRDSVRYMQDHGIVYTFKRASEKLHNICGGDCPKTKLKTRKNAIHSTEKTGKTPDAVCIANENRVLVQPVGGATDKGDSATNQVRNYHYYANLKPEDYPKELALWFKKRTGEDLDLANPKTYNEKIQWMKLYDATPLKTQLSDKYESREWVSAKIGSRYLVPLLGVWDSFDEIDFETLPDKFVLKANHGCGYNIIVDDKKRLDIQDAKTKFEKWMNTNFAFVNGLELQYMNIRPRIIAEAYLENENNDLYDYKVFCFNGKAESILFISERKAGKKIDFFDTDWNRLPISCGFPQNEDEIAKPQNLKLMIKLAEKLSEGFPHVRVDFYIMNDGSIRFGEMTFSSSSGILHWNPPEQNTIYGKLIKLPPKREIPQICTQSKKDET